MLNFVCISSGDHSLRSALLSLSLLLSYITLLYNKRCEHNEPIFCSGRKAHRVFWLRKQWIATEWKWKEENFRRLGFRNAKERISTREVSIGRSEKRNAATTIYHQTMMFALSRSLIPCDCRLLYIFWWHKKGLRRKRGRGGKNERKMY